MSLELSLFLRAEIGQDLEGRTPLLELHLPVDDDSGGYNDKMWTPNTLITSQGGKHRDRLNGLTKTHLIGKDAIELLVVQSYQPIKTDDLILSQRPLQEERYLGLDLHSLKCGTSGLETFCHFDSLLSY